MTKELINNNSLEARFNEIKISIDQVIKESNGEIDQLLEYLSEELNRYIESWSLPAQSKDEDYELNSMVIEYLMLAMNNTYGSNPESGNSLNLIVV